MLDWGDTSSLALAEESPCVSIYVQTTPVSNYREENRIRYKDQVKQAHAALDARDMDKFVRARLVEQLESVGTTEVFWTHQQYGLAVFVSPERFMVRRMLRTPDEPLTIVGDSFHLRPALRETANWMRYQVLCVSLHDVALYDCNRENMVAIDLHNDVPQDMGEALLKTEHSANAKDSNSTSNDSNELKHYFEAVDQSIRDHHNGRTKRPLVLALISEHQGLFRQVSGNPNLLENGLTIDPFEAIREQRLGQSAWEIASDAVDTNIVRLTEQYRERQAHGEGESGIEQAAYAATIGQIETVLIDEEARVEGTIDSETGRITYGRPDDTNTDDVLDAIAALVMRFEGDVVFIPTAQMPTETGVAAVLRFAMQPS